MHGDCDDAAAAAEDAVLPDELLEVCEVVLQLAMSFSSTKFMWFFTLCGHHHNCASNCHIVFNNNIVDAIPSLT